MCTFAQLCRMLIKQLEGLRICSGLWCKRQNVYDDERLYIVSHAALLIL